MIAFLSVFAFSSAFLIGAVNGPSVRRWFQGFRVTKKKVRSEQEIWASAGVSRAVLTYAMNLRRGRAAEGDQRSESALGRYLVKGAELAGPASSLNDKDALDCAMRLAVCFGAIGLVLGFVVSNECAIAGLVLGAFLGFGVLPWSLRQESRARVREIEMELPEMLDIVSLGLQSGLSFDRSLLLYCEHFSTSLTSAWREAYRQWNFGLMTREDAMRALADSYDSALLDRTVSAIGRSLRFGTAASVEFSRVASEARATVRAKRQEHIAKAPVKMMVPTGTLILPSMLILVLGPVLLQLAEGF